MRTVVVNTDILQSWLVISDLSQDRLAHQLHVSRVRFRRLLRRETELPTRVIGSLLLMTQLPFERLFSVASRSSLIARDGRFNNFKHSSVRRTASMFSINKQIAR